MLSFRGVYDEKSFGPSKKNLLMQDFSSLRLNDILLIFQKIHLDSSTTESQRFYLANKFFSTNNTFAGRSANRRMYQGYQNSP